MDVKFLKLDWFWIFQFRFQTIFQKISTGSIRLPGKQNPITGHPRRHTTIVAFESVQAERNLRICELSKTRVEDELPTQTLHFFCRGKSLKITQTKFALFDSQDPWKKKKSSKKTMAQIHSRKRKPKKTPLSSNIQVDTSGNNRDGRVLQSFPGSKNLLVSH